MTSEAATQTPVDRALARSLAAFDQLLAAVEDGGLDHFDNGQRVEFAQAFERLRNRMPLVDHRLIRDGLARDLPEALCQTGMVRVLAQALRISAAEASRRVRAAEQVGARVSMLGEPMDPVRPVLAAAQRAGEVTPEQVDIIRRGLAGVDRAGFDPADLTLGEQLLTGQAKTFGPKDLKDLTDRVVDAINPDGTLPNDQLNQDRRHFHLRPTRDGGYAGEFRLTGTLGAKLAALLEPFAKPRTGKVEHADGSVTQQSDGRTRGQRMHDALEDVCDRLLKAGDLPDTGGTPTTVIVTITVEDLLDRLGYGRTSDGTLIPAATVLEMANEAEIIPVVLSKTGAVMAMGRERRIATQTQTYALYARDHGCSFPGCDRPPEHCERHHIKEWVDGGLTDLDNLTLLCRYHHHNFAARGWTCTLNIDGIPEWTPPKWVDRDQKPLINNRIINQQLKLRRKPTLRK